MRQKREGRPLLELAQEGAEKLRDKMVYHASEGEWIENLTFDGLMKELFSEQEINEANWAMVHVGVDQKYFDRELRIKLGEEMVLVIKAIEQFIPANRDFSNIINPALTAIRQYIKRAFEIRDKWSPVFDLLHILRDLKKPRAFSETNIPQLDEASIMVQWPTIDYLVRASGMKLRTPRGSKHNPIPGALLPMMREATEIIMSSVFLSPARETPIWASSPTLSLYMGSTKVYEFPFASEPEDTT